ncbi:hypothetical protein [Promicromonospora soli]
MTGTKGLLELGAQIRAALDQLPPDADATVRLRHGAGPVLAEAAVWAVPAAGSALVRQLELPAAAIGLRMGLVEEALDQAGVHYPTADLGLRARWRRVTSNDEVLGFELSVRSIRHHGGRPITTGKNRAGHT